jgi:hypothetical protein
MLTSQEIEDLKIKHGEVLHIRGAGGKWEVVLKPPSIDNYELFIANSQNPARKHLAQYGIVRSMLVHPSRDEFDKVRSRYVGIVEACCADKRFSEFLGMEVEAAGE